MRRFDRRFLSSSPPNGSLRASRARWRTRLGTLANAGAPGFAHYALDRGDEVFAALTFLAELKSFASGDGSLAESVYGLQRVPRTLTDCEGETRWKVSDRCVAANR